MAADRVGARSPGAEGAPGDPTRPWLSEAACRGHDAVLFFGPNAFESKADRIAREAEAKRVCATCPVLGPCRTHALEVAEPYGVWGGLGETDRRAVLVAEGRLPTAV